MEAGVTAAGGGLLGVRWSILGQIYVPMQISEASFAWHATFPPGHFVPPHIHAAQDEFIYMLQGRFELALGGESAAAGPGDLIRLPMGQPHGIFNRSTETVTCLFWVAPKRRLWDLFQGIHDLPEQTPEAVTAIAARHEVEFLPPPPGAG